MEFFEYLIHLETLFFYPGSLAKVGEGKGSPSLVSLPVLTLDTPHFLKSTFEGQVANILC